MGKAQIFGLSLSLLLAGCLGEATSDRAQGDPGFTDPHAPPAVDDESGGILGTIVDEALLPVADAFAVLDGAQTVATGIDGSFRFGLVAPGEHVIAAAKDGYASSELTVQVVAGEIVAPRLSLVSLAAAAAYHETKIATGLIGCGFSVSVNGIAPTPAVCGAGEVAGLPTQSLNKHISDTHWGDVEADWTGFWVETAWRSTQALGNRMTLNWWGASAPIGTPGRVLMPIANATLAGTSPVRAHFLLAEAQAWINSTLESRPICIKTCIISGGHFAAAEDNGVGLTIQQRYDDYVTLFHHDEVPLEFTALADG